MSASRIAKRYARPLLDLAEEQKLLDEVRQDMETFVTICRENKGFVAMLKSPIIVHLKKADILNKIFEGKINELTLMVFSLITRKNREDVLPQVAEEFLKLYNIKKGYQEATITTTFTIDDAIRDSVKEIVKEISGKTPLLVEKVDPEIVGGYILMMGDRQIDESLSGKLKELELKFKQQQYAQN